MAPSARGGEILLALRLQSFRTQLLVRFREGPRGTNPVLHPVILPASSPFPSLSLSLSILLILFILLLILRAPGGPKTESLDAAAIF